MSYKVEKEKEVREAEWAEKERNMLALAGLRLALLAHPEGPPPLHHNSRAAPGDVHRGPSL